MPVGRVYWHFDALAAYVRLTSPWGSGEDEESETIAPCKKCGEVEAHALDCPNYGKTPSRKRKGGTNETVSGFDFREKTEAAGLSRGVNTLKRSDVKDAELFDLLNEADIVL